MFLDLGNLMNPSVASLVAKPIAVRYLADLATYLPFISAEQVAAMEGEWDQYKALVLPL